MAEIVMPRLSDTMEEGTILRWLKRDGEHVARGEELVEIETDKATMSYESDQSGTLQTLAGEGDTLAVGALIAHVGAEQPRGAAEQRAEEEDDGPASRPAGVGTAAADGGTAAKGGALAGGSAGPAQAAGAPAERPAGARVKASPLARRLARDSHVDLAALSGSGPGGRIVRADVLAAGGAADAAGPPAAEGTRAAGGAAAAEGTRAAGSAAGGGADGKNGQPGDPGAPGAGAGLAGVATAKGEATTVALSRSQQTIARRMAESKATIPDFALQREVEMEACVALRAELKRLSGREAPTYNDMVVKACALALREHPRANCSYRDGSLQLHARVNVGVAVAVEAGDGQPAGGAGPSDPGAGSLVVPTVFDADAKSLGEIARETRTLAGRVRDGSITPPELGGGTFTVSNLGMFGVGSFSAIINPPQVAILAVGAVTQRAVARDGELAVRHAMSATLVCDHRVLYGAGAALFLARICELLEAPAALTL